MGSSFASTASMGRGTDVGPAFLSYHSIAQDGANGKEIKRRKRLRGRSRCFLSGADCNTTSQRQYNNCRSGTAILACCNQTSGNQCRSYLPIDKWFPFRWFSDKREGRADQCFPILSANSFRGCALRTCLPLRGCRDSPLHTGDIPSGISRPRRLSLQRLWESVLSR